MYVGVGVGLLGTFDNESTPQPSRKLSKDHLWRVPLISQISSEGLHRRLGGTDGSVFSHTCRAFDIIFSFDFYKHTFSYTEQELFGFYILGLMQGILIFSKFNCIDIFEIF